MDNDMEDKLNAILQNPDTMRQLQAMAQSLGLQSPPPPPTPPQQSETLPNFDPAVLQKLSGFAQQSNVDKNQKALLAALGPYLSHDRLGRLEKAMRAAKMAQFASGFLGQGGLSILTGR